MFPGLIVRHLQCPHLGYIALILVLAKVDSSGNADSSHFMHQLCTSLLSYL